MMHTADVIRPQDPRLLSKRDFEFAGVAEVFDVPVRLVNPDAVTRTRAIASVLQMEGLIL